MTVLCPPPGSSMNNNNNNKNSDKSIISVSESTASFVGLPSAGDYKAIVILHAC